MPNINAPFGCMPIEQGDGSPWNGKANVYVIPSSDGSAFYIGDLVKSAAGADTNGISAVAKAAAGDPVRGIIVGVFPVQPDLPSLVGTDLALSTLTVPATKARDYYVAVCDDPGVVFEIQGDTTGTNQVAANANKNANVTVAAPSSGSQSATVVNSSSIAVTFSLGIKLMGLSRRRLPGGNAFGASAIWRARFNVHELMGSVTAV